MTAPATTLAASPGASGAVGGTYPLPDDKRFETARAVAALRGVCLMRTDPRDQCVRYIFELADGQLGELRSLDDVLEAP